MSVSPNPHQNSPHVDPHSRAANCDLGHKVSCEMVLRSGELSLSFALFWTRRLHDFLPDS